MTTTLSIELHSDGDRALFAVTSEQGDRSNPVEIAAPTSWPGVRANSNLARDLQWYLETFLDYPFEPHLDTAAQITESRRAWGVKTFEDLFGSGHPRDWYRDATRNSVEGLELRVIADNHPEVLAWPWEALQHPEGESLGTQISIRRQPRLGREPLPVPSELPSDQLNILLVTARPFERDVEFTSISRPLVELINSEGFPGRVTLLRPPTLTALKAHLKEQNGRYHVLHFDGHGGFGSGVRETGDGYRFRSPRGHLVFEGADTQPTAVDAADLADVLRDCGVPVVVLNACQSAMTDAEGASSSDPADQRFSSVAASLANAGIRSVVAMAYSLYVSGARVFLPAFYRELFRTGTCAKAVLAGRQAMRTHPYRVCARGTHPLDDWIVPVLYERNPVTFELGSPVQSLPSLESLLEAQDESAVAPAATGPHTQSAGLERGERFVGRGGVIQRLERAIRADTPAVLIHGLGGVGKTTLARGFVSWLAETDGPFDGAVFVSFVDARSAEFVFNRIGEVLFGQQFLQLPENGKWRVLAETLYKHPVLVIWDNFENAAGFDESRVPAQLDQESRSQLATFLQALRGGRSKILISSRSDANWLPTDCRQVLMLHGLTGEEQDQLTHAMLRDLGLERLKTDPDLKTLVRAMGGHPLAMRVVLPRLERMTPTQALERFRENLAELVAGDNGGDAEAVNHLYAPLRFATDGLPEELRPLLTLVALHERYVDSHLLRLMARKIDERWDDATIGRFVNAMTHAGLVRPMHGVQEHGVLLDLHPALAGHLRSSWLPGLDDAERSRWTRAFVEVMARLADAIAGQQGHEQQPFHTVHGVNFRSALELAQADEDENALLAALTQSLAVYAQHTLNFDEAEQLYRQLADVRESRGDERGVAGAYHQLGRVAEERRDFDAAAGWYKRALEIKERLGDEHGAAITYHQLGRMAEERRDFEAAEGWYTKSLEIKERLGDEHGAANTYHQLGRVAEERRDFDAAEGWYKKSLEIEERLGNEHGAATTYHQLGSVAEERRDLDAAEEWYKKALEISERLGDERGAALTHGQLANLALVVKCLESAEYHYMCSLKISERLGDEPTNSISYHQLGVVSQERRDLDAAEAWYKKSLEINERLGDQHGAAITYAQLGLLAKAREDLPASVSYFARAAGSFAKTNDQHTSLRSILDAAKSILLARESEREGMITIVTEAGIPREVLDKMIESLRSAQPESGDQPDDG